MRLNQLKNIIKEELNRLKENDPGKLQMDEGVVSSCKACFKKGCDCNVTSALVVTCTNCKEKGNDSRGGTKGKERSADKDR